MLTTIYHFEMNTPIINNLACLGKFDGLNSSLCFATLGGKITIYNPHQKNENLEGKGHVSLLNLNKEVTALCFGPLGDRECLYIGSPTSLMCYDLLENKTLFDKDILDGVYCLTSGYFSNYNFPMCIVGGNCSLQAFDSTGEEKFWTVTGGNTVCLSLNDVDNDSFQELIVGTDDFAIRMYKNENNISEINENTKIVLIHSIANSKFVYGLENGTIGLYDRGERVWKKKEKGQLNSVVSKDFNNDGYDEIICGLSSGKLQIRAEKNGDIIYELILKNEISKLLLGDLNSSGGDQIVLCTSNGEIYGFKYSTEESKLATDIKIVTKDSKINKEELSKYEKLLAEKTDLMNKIEDVTVRISEKGKLNAARDEISLPTTTQVKIDLQSNNDNKCADLIVESSPGTIIKCIVVISEQLYKGETFAQYPSEETNKVVIQVKNEKDMNINLHIKVLVGLSFFSKDFQVFEYNKIIPKYCFYILLRDDVSQYKIQYKQGISFKINERLERLLIWLQDNFNIPIKELSLFKNSDNIYDIRFMSLRTDKVLQISMQNTTIRIMTDEIELAGNILQDLCKFFQISELDTSIGYPDIVEETTSLLRRIEKLDSVRNQFNINMTEIITYIKDIFVRAEDNRLLDNLQGFKDYFMKINVRNLELLDEFEKRTQTYEELISDLKKINNYIQYFANLKVGSFKNKMISLCRESIKTKNYKLLIKVITTGQA